MSYRALKPLLFRLDAERAHNLAVTSLKTLQHTRAGLDYYANRFTVSDPRLAQSLWGYDFANPVGLAAGFDKNGQVINAMTALGFGFVEIGTVTPRPQPGNPKPRMFRLADDQSLQNALGFNNEGMTAVAKRLERSRPFPVPLGINFGKNKSTPDEETLDDYAALAETFGDLAAYYVINISSPNTPGLRGFQNEDFIVSALERLLATTDRPIFVKLSPDEEAARLGDLADAAVSGGAGGIVATNTTIDYSLSRRAKQTGGISGALLREKSRAALRVIADRVFGRATVISAGGIDSAEEAYLRIRTGAALVQVYTGLIYKGPGLIRDINQGILSLLERDGLESLGEAIGSDIAK